MSRYHPLLVTLHWLLAIMIVMGLIMGGNVLSETANSDPQKIGYLKIHMLMGMLIFILMIVRLIVRFFSSRPPHADIGNSLFNKLGVATHYVFYIVVIAMAASGFATANMAGLPEIIFDGVGSLPATFDGFAPRKAHGVLSMLLTLLIAGHVAAFFYHQFIRKDHLFSRMWFGDRK